MHQQDADRMAKSVDTEQAAWWVYTVCLDLSV